MALGELAGRLCAELEAKGLGARRLDLLIFRVDGQVGAVRVGSARGSRDPGHIVRLFREKLDKVDPGFGIEALVLTASTAERLGPRQLEANDAGEPEPDLGVLVDQIANRIGGRRLYRLTPVESDLPERALRRVPALSTPIGASWPEGPRPARLFDPPQTVDVVALLPDHPPAAFTWQGRRRRIRHADGPERVYGEWWRSDGEIELVRDYFRAEDEHGQRFWLFRATDRDGVRWFLHGLFA
jgi:protein ImuB